jgi:uncharacterized protein (TIRG00374 family)
MSRIKVVRMAAAVLGLGMVVFLIHRTGPASMAGLLARLGPTALLVTILPSLAMYLVDVSAWRVTLKSAEASVGFGTLFAIRTAGEAVNSTTPTASIGGEPVKAYLLTTLGVPFADALASTVVAKGAMIAAQILFMLIGLGLWVEIFWSRRAFEPLLLGAAVAVGTVVFAVVGAAAVRRHGIFSALVGIFRTCGLRAEWLKRREPFLRKVDGLIFGFYERERSRCYRAVALFLLGFGFEAIEVYVMLRFLGVAVDPAAAWSISALSLVIKNGSSVIPWSLGAQDGGNVLLVTLFGWSDSVGMAFALLRRVRELIWIGAGFLALAFLRMAPRQPKACG